MFHINHQMLSPAFSGFRFLLCTANGKGRTTQRLDLRSVKDDAGKFSHCSSTSFSCCSAHWFWHASCTVLSIKATKKKWSSTKTTSTNWNSYTNAESLCWSSGCVCFSKSLCWSSSCVNFTKSLCWSANLASWSVCQPAPTASKSLRRSTPERSVHSAARNTSALSPLPVPNTCLCTIPASGLPHYSASGISRISGGLPSATWLPCLPSSAKPARPTATSKLLFSSEWPSVEIRWRNVKTNFKVNILYIKIRQICQVLSL